MSKNLELEAGVSSALDERRGLLERCVAAESETERYDVSILKNAFDDGSVLAYNLLNDLCHV